MKRLIFFFLLVGAIVATCCLLLFSVEYSLFGDTTGFEHLKEVITSIKDGAWKWSSFGAPNVFTYGFVLLLFINAVVLLSLLVMALTTLLKFNRVYRFYATTSWLLLAAFLFTGTIVYLLIDAGSASASVFKELPWQFYVPLVSSIALMITGAILKRSERG